MLSQPATKIFLPTSEPRAAKWISDTIEEVEIELCLAKTSYTLRMYDLAKARFRLFG
jgi:hypothetical protein